MIIGLTGGIGSGKSTVAKMFSDLGIAVFIADDEAKKLMNSSQEIHDEIITAFGEETYTNKGLNRKFLATVVFNHKEQLELLNSIVHPKVKKHFNDWCEHQKSPYVIKEAAILFENDGYTYCDEMILVTAPKETRIERVLERDGMKREEILARMENQWDDEKKIPLSDYVIENVDIEKTRAEVDKIHNLILKKSS
ncbi:dephospho-CoA kinase [Flavobacteriaceae bacterium R38]|nr:dephospho-CoA kinase [Flavobacteriaceae bacterium R38]